MKIHRLLCAFTALIAFFSAFCVIASAEITADFENGSFYAPADIQEKLYELIINCYSNVKEGVTGATAPASELETIKVIKTIKEKGLVPEKDSAIQLYTFRVDYEQTDKIALVISKWQHYDKYMSDIIHGWEQSLSSVNELPDMYVIHPEYREQYEELAKEHLIIYKHYFVKMLTPDGEAAGYLLIQADIDNDDIYHLEFMYRSEAYAKLTSDPKDGYSAPLSYADQAERIRDLFSLDEILPPENVRLVSYSCFKFFYVKAENIEAFVPVGSVLPGAPDDVFIPEHLKYQNTDDISISIDLKKGYLTVDEMAEWVRCDHDIFFKRLEESTQYLREHGTVLIGGPGVSMSETVSGSVKAGKAYNVTDIKGYFEGKASAANLSASDSERSGKTEESPANIWLPVGAAAAIIAVFAAGAVIFIKKKAK